MENHQPKRPASAGTQTNGIYEEIIRHLATTREGREFIAGLVPALVRLWADSGADAGFARDAVRRGVAGIAEGSIKNTFLDPRAFHQAPSLSTLGSDPDFMQHACRQLERSLDAACDTLSDVLAKMETLNTDGKKAILTALFSSLGGGRTANAITSACRVINDIHTDDPHFLAAILRPGFEKWIENLDFAEIKDFLDSGTEGFSALIQMANTVMWQYPGKVVAIMTWLPSILNMLLDALTKTVSVFNEKGAPDLVADILLTLFREVKPDTVAALFNESTEIIRKFHTGSALIGEPGAPRLPGDLYANLSEITAQINAETLSKARLALAEIREAASCSLIDALEEQPALMEEAIKNKSGRYNARIRTAHHRLSAADSMDPDRFQASVKAFFSAFDTQETADTANTGAVLLNRILEAAPDTVSEKTAAFADSLDPFEASELLQALRNRTGHALMPLARACIPHLVEGLLTALAPADDEFEDAAKQARKKLFSFLHSQGGQTHD